MSGPRSRSYSLPDFGRRSFCRPGGRMWTWSARRSDLPRQRAGSHKSASFPPPPWRSCGIYLGSEKAVRLPSPTDPQTHRKDIKPQWERVREAAGLEDVTLHDLRRTAGSFMAQAGVPLQVIQHVLGHRAPGGHEALRTARQQERAGGLRDSGRGTERDPLERNGSRARCRT